MNNTPTPSFVSTPAFCRIAPFAAFMLFIGVEESMAFLQKLGLLHFSETARLWLYAPKMALTGMLLIIFRPRYDDIRFSDLTKVKPFLVSSLTGIVIFILWIKMDWTLSSQTVPPGFDPGKLADGLERWLMIFLRCIGAVIVVPVMEELFWRSFLLRWLVDKDFTRVAPGTLSWVAFLVTTVLFGLEHHYLFAGMMAGALFNLVYWYTRSLAHCILSHAMANLSLASYVLATAQWQFW